MTVSVNTKQVDGIGEFFNNSVKKELNVSKKWARNVLSNPEGALDLTAKIDAAAVCKNSKQAPPTLPELITFYNTGKGLYLGNFV